MKLRASRRLPRGLFIWLAARTLAVSFIFLPFVCAKDKAKNFWGKKLACVNGYFDVLAAELVAISKMRVLKIRDCVITEQAVADVGMAPDLRLLRFEKCFFDGSYILAWGQLFQLKKLSILNPTPDAAEMFQPKM